MNRRITPFQRITPFNIRINNVRLFFSVQKNFFECSSIVFALPVLVTGENGKKVFHKLINTFLKIFTLRQKLSIFMISEGRLHIFNCYQFMV